MKTINLVVAMSLVLGGCSSAPSYEERQVKVMEQVELAGMQKHGFCEASKLFSYIETRFYYQWTCSDGRNFMLPKER